MKTFESGIRSIILALPLMGVVGVAQASTVADMPAPGIFGLLALGMIGALAIARSRK